MGIPAHKARAKHHIGYALFNGRETRWIRGWIGFYVGILEVDQIAASVCYARAQCRALALVFRVVEDCER